MPIPISLSFTFPAYLTCPSFSQNLHQGDPRIDHRRMNAPPSSFDLSLLAVRPYSQSKLLGSPSYGTKETLIVRLLAQRELRFKLARFRDNPDELASSYRRQSLRNRERYAELLEILRSDYSDRHKTISEEERRTRPDWGIAIFEGR